MSLVFKRASEPEELAALGRLNYETFVEEIPQHGANPERRLDDPYLPKSVAFVAKDGDEVVGMVAVCDQRPFSLDRKLPDLDRWLAPYRKPCEVRLLAVRRERRGGAVLAGLLACIYRHCQEQGNDAGFISGTLRQLRLYRHLGFEPFGPPLGTAEAPYQAMVVTWDRLAPSVRGYVERSQPTVSLLPGPVDVAPGVRRAFGGASLSHRDDAFLAVHRRLREALCELTGAADVQLLLGTGTTANDAVSARLRQVGGRGVVLTNGEFGDRLVDHARRERLDFATLDAPWGEPLPLAARELVDGSPSWIWAVHCETSTGVLNDLDALRRLAERSGAVLALDAISSLGTVPVDLRGVAFASATSGKGLASYAGLAMVFTDQRPGVQADAPRSLDLGLYAEEDGVPFTSSSHLVRALAESVRGLAADDRWAGRFADRRALASWLRRQVVAAGYELLAREEIASPAVLTLVPPSGVEAAAVAGFLQQRGFLPSFRSGYLRRRNVLQLCLMGHQTREQLAPLAGLLRDALQAAGAAPQAIAGAPHLADPPAVG